MRKLLYTQLYGAKPAAFVLVLWMLFFTPGQTEARVGVGPSWSAPEAFTGLMLSQGWEDLSPGQRQRALKNFKRFQQLSPKQQRILEQQYRQWRSLSPQERQRIRKNYERYHRLDPYEKEEFEERYHKWKSHPQRK